MAYLDEFLNYYSYSGELTRDFANKINYYFGVPFEYLKEGKMNNSDLKKIILEHNGPSNLEKDLENENYSLITGNF